MLFLQDNEIFNGSNPERSLDDFKRLMGRTDDFLNCDAKNRHEYYASRNGLKLEDDVESALNASAADTGFQGKIIKVSGQNFPDITVAGCYGVEVKSTKEDKWTSTGSSILETMRVPGVEKIYMTFGKLGGNPIEFISKPYEECLYDIAVTHSPRYLINMNLPVGETIFEKMGVPYDAFRKDDDPIGDVVEYYKAKKQCDGLWWIRNPETESSPFALRIWKNVSKKERQSMTAYALYNFPEVFAGDYDRYSIWLTTQGIVDSHIRDQFSAGGLEKMRLPDGSTASFPGVFRRIKENKESILAYIDDELNGGLSGNKIAEKAGGDVTNQAENELISKWIDAVSRAYSKNDGQKYSQSVDALSVLFFDASWLSKLDD